MRVVTYTRMYIGDSMNVTRYVRYYKGEFSCIAEFTQAHVNSVTCATVVDGCGISVDIAHALIDKWNRNSSYYHYLYFVIYDEI